MFDEPQAEHFLIFRGGSYTSHVTHLGDRAGASDHAGSSDVDSSAQDSDSSAHDILGFLVACTASLIRSHWSFPCSVCPKYRLHPLSLFLLLLLLPFGSMQQVKEQEIVELYRGQVVLQLGAVSYTHLRAHET